MAARGSRKRRKRPDSPDVRTCTRCWKLIRVEYSYCPHCGCRQTTWRYFIKYETDKNSE